ncbi:MAG: thermonuclease family protein [Rickettsiales bacterium]|jgi:DNA modification methylase|nr:thermonuclease family protein [Rickettsiales bacterium]
MPDTSNSGILTKSDKSDVINFNKPSQQLKTSHTLINGDSRQMNLLQDESVHLIITSPPYWQLKDYGTEEQIGFHDSYENYINDLNQVWNECNRILHKGCRLCINIGDQFARSVYYGRYKVIPIRTEIIKFCEILELDYMGAIIWQKQTTMNTTGGGAVMGSFPYPRNGIIKMDYEFILIFKKQGETKTTKEQKELSIIPKDDWNKYFSSHWTFGGCRQDGHIAMFPEELPARLIKMFSFVGETVFDPFMGSGTTALAAKNLSRNSIGYEINTDFIEIYNKKIKTSDLLKNDEYKYYTDKYEYKNKKELPYIFKDPHKLDKKVDIKKLQFGSKLDNNKIEKEQYYSVKEIISPIMIKLNNNLIIKLLGLKEKECEKDKAIEFLDKKIKGQKVFLKYDNTKYDNEGNLLCYLYLKNKTFINAHLLKNNFVEIDNNIDFIYKNKFIGVYNGKRMDFKSSDK